MNLRGLSLDRTPPADYEPPEPIGADRSLTAWADYYGSDKGTLKHNYTAVYEPLLAKFRGRRHLTVLEIGVACGASLKMWSRYFPAAHVTGIDIRPECRDLCAGYRNVAIVIADATKQAVGGGYDIVIDDGSHIAGHIARTFALYWPLLNPGGIYIVEDLRCTHNPNYSVPFPVDEADKDRRHLMHLIDHMLRVMDSGGECESIEFRQELMILRKR